MRVRVYHSLYGCETGCCGHVVEIDDDKTYFQFRHPGHKQDFRQFARELAEDSIRDRWPECLESIDWDTMEVDVVDD